MCGRTGLSLKADQVQCACSYKENNSNAYSKPAWLPEHNAGKEYVPSYNIAPTDVTPVLISSNKFKNSSHSSRILKPMMWGMIPMWHKGDYKSHNLSTNNCRLENIQNSKLYYPALKNGGRCIIIVEGFYEWQTTEKNIKNKQPYYIYAPQDSNILIDDPDTWNNKYDMDNGWQGVRLLHMAGIYNVWQNEDTIIYSYSIITMDSNNTLSWLHHRMPAVLQTEEQIEAWLDIEKVNPDMALSYLKPVKMLSWHKVSTSVNNSRNKSQDCNKKLKEDSIKSQKTLNSWLKVEKRKSIVVPDSNIKRIKKHESD